MILDSVKHLNRYAGLSAAFGLAIEYLSRNDLTKLEPGRYPIAGDEVYLMIQQPELKKWEEGHWEGHRRYADIQVVLSGEERIGYAPAETLEPETEYSEEKDFLFFKDTETKEKKSEELRMLLHPGEFAVFFPQDAHRPCIKSEGSDETVRKAVVKVRL
ncbi:MAG: YhcH/YjgK/YiaL family protein [Candidatus Limiplasma sp.]|nr:YhcH/YjgK/YiaL family protein [Clostridiales bacterium]MDY3242958.1 YhcH/YjgK/YiaL family protein [Candidatus Limiplasma sp.]